MVVLRGDRFLVRHPLETHGLIAWHAPVTSSFPCTIPADTVLVVRHDLREGATAVMAVPEDEVSMEQLLVPEDQRMDPQYGGYYFVISLNLIGNALQPLPASAPFC